jgi:GntR family transcriptional regulator, transcriptional repressor for pyruvate dehydrogenase complex
LDERQSSDADRWVLPPSRRPVPELVCDRVLELVRSGDLAAGSRLPTEPELARLFGVARSSVRTGLQRAEARGIVEVNRGIGWFVTSEPLRSASDLMRDRLAGEDFDIVDVMEVRIALESTAAALAASRADRGALDDILKLSRAHQEADHDDAASLLRTDEEFHGAIVEASGNRYLQTLYEMVTPLISEWREGSYTSPAVHDRSVNDHNQIAVQLRRGDEVGARIAMTTHLLGLYKGIVRERRPQDADGGVSADLGSYVGVEDAPEFG